MTARTIRRLATALALAWLLGACASAPVPVGPPPDQVQGEIVRRIPASVADREGWATDIRTALASQRIDPIVENICAVLAVTEQETGYQVDPVVPNLAAISRDELYRRAAERHVPKFVLDGVLKLRSTDGRTYAERLAAVRTEAELSGIYEDLTGRVRIAENLMESFNPVQTGGPMQVSVAFAEEHARGYPYPVQDSIRREVFSRRGGMYFGIVHLLGYTTPYTRKVHRFADYNAGWYASRNAAFQNAVAIATGRTLALDGDLLRPGAPLRSPGETEAAVRTLAGQLRLDDEAIRAQLRLGDRLAFNDSALFGAVFALAEARAREPLPRAMIPGITLESPKITRQLTTAWFATRVDQRYRQCLAR